MNDKQRRAYISSKSKKKEEYLKKLQERYLLLIFQDTLLGADILIVPCEHEITEYQELEIDRAISKNIDISIIDANKILTAELDEVLNDDLSIYERKNKDNETESIDDDLEYGLELSL